MGRKLAVAALQLATAFVAAMAIGLVLTLAFMAVSDRTFAGALHRMLLIVGILVLLCAAAAQSPTRSAASGPGYDRLGGLVPGLNRWATSGESAASGSLMPAALFLVVGIASLVIAFLI
jgi:hypothetical protein